uniref:Uncharacterized protein n=1 Tax=Parascaris equorum TaxID=6256 RepID=A0A914S378_PAREQ
MHSKQLSTLLSFFHFAMGNATSANQASGHSLTAVYASAMIMHRSVIKRQVHVLNVAISLMAIIVIVASLAIYYAYIGMFGPSC